MTTNELKEKLQREKSDFYAWEPGGQDPERRFRCHHIPSRPIVHLGLCRNRARKPEIFQVDCSGCPRWKFYRKLATSRKRAYK